MVFIMLLKQWECIVFNSGRRPRNNGLRELNTLNIHFIRHSKNNPLEGLSRIKDKNNRKLNS